VPDLTVLQYAFLAFVGLVVGIINAMAGGASVLMYSALMAVGANPVAAVVTNAWGVTPANLVAQFTAKEKLKDLYRDNWQLLWLSVIGTVIGAVALMNMPIATLEKGVPVLLLLAGLSVLIPVKREVGGLTQRNEQLAIFGTGLYCGYFGPGQGVMVAATLARDPRRTPLDLNGLKNFITGYTSLISNFVFLASGEVYWGLIGLIAIFASIGGFIGGKLAGKLSPSLYRGILLTVALGASGYFFVKFW
jgi:uncharacterized membrane protein YfcA